MFALNHRTHKSISSFYMRQLLFVTSGEMHANVARSWKHTAYSHVFHHKKSVLCTHEYFIISTQGCIMSLIFLQFKLAHKWIRDTLFYRREINWNVDKRHYHRSHKLTSIQDKSMWIKITQILIFHLYYFNYIVMWICIPCKLHSYFVVTLVLN